MVMGVIAERRQFLTERPDAILTARTMWVLANEILSILIGNYNQPTSSQAFCRRPVRVPVRISISGSDILY